MPGPFANNTSICVGSSTWPHSSRSFSGSFFRQRQPCASQVAVRKRAKKTRWNRARGWQVGTCVCLYALSPSLISVSASAALSLSLSLAYVCEPKFKLFRFHYWLGHTLIVLFRRCATTPVKNVPAWMLWGHDLCAMFPGVSWSKPKLNDFR